VERRRSVDDPVGENWYCHGGSFLCELQM
jgi:hypothetical protein